MGNKRKISRKQFIRYSTIGILSAGMIRKKEIARFTGDLSGTVTLGNTGIQMTRLGYGASRTQEPALLRYVLDQGISFLDTGRSYAQGKNEEMIGEVIRESKYKPVIQSKVRLPVEKILEETPIGQISKAVRKKFNQSLHESLLALRRDHIDILLFHGAENQKELFHEAVMESFARAKEQGKIRAAGFSTHIHQESLLARSNKTNFYDVAMVAFNPSGRYAHSKNERTGEWNQEGLISELKKAAAAGTGIIAMKTCSGGPYPPYPDAEPTLPGAVKWVLEREYVHSSAVAMANFKEVGEHTTG